MQCAIIIPARYASSRLRGKPLLRETGKYMIQHVYEQALQSQIASQVIIATDDSRIQAACARFKAPCFMTSKKHPSGTDRVAEVASQLNCALVLNLQGDEPLANPQAIDLLFRQLLDHPESSMATLATPIRNNEEFHNSNCVKVVHDSQGRALYFSRSPIPYCRDGQPDFSPRPSPYLLHLGMYAYRKEFLLKLAEIPVHPLENIEKLEQLRVLASGQDIRLGIVEERTLGVDTYEDYQRFVQLQRRKSRDCAA
ncbi:MAG: 3-deoxy-manno-octulosonate cytidylyltransferase [Gemmataceae bacterium]|nr:3-deoxy-manno-octulosonate cytidylyltransferase [Gemmataceae bacterium]